MMAALSLLLTCLVIPTGGSLIALFGISKEAVSIGHNFFTRLALFYVVYGLATSIRGYLEGMGDVVYSSITGILALVSRIIASYAWVSFFGNMVIAYSEAFSWGILLVLYLLRLLYRNRSEKRT